MRRIVRAPAVLLLALLVLAGLVANGAQAHVGEEASYASADLPLSTDITPGPFGPRFQALSTAERAADLPAPAASAPGSFEQVGHDPLLNRGMNSALAVLGDYAYVGSRTDGSHANSGVLVVDVGDPAKPEVVDEIGPPEEGNPSESSRELRILPEQKLLLVLNHGCSELIHRCASPANTGRPVLPSTIKFFDIAGENARRPKLVSTYSPSRSAPQLPHEFFVWSDPARPGRVLMYSTTPSSDSSGRDNLVVTDLSRAREDVFPEVAKFTTRIGNPERDNRLHSLTVSADGRRGYFAYLGGGFLVADLSDFAAARPEPKVRLVTPVADRVFWTDPGAHSAIKLPGRDHVLMTDEVYGKLGGVLPEHGCPWGWVRFIDIARPEKPRIESEYRLPSNDPSICDTVGEDRDNLSSFSSHNPTLTRNLALITWHSAGLQAVDTSDPARPSPAAAFSPEPLETVQTEDPALSSGPDKVVMWSFPVVKDGLIYVIDLRNGLYVLRYKGPHQQEVAETRFLDGNSNSGDQLRLEGVARRGGSGGGSGGSGAGGAGSRAGTACLAAPVRLRSRRLGPFSLGLTARGVDLRGGPAARRTSTRRRFCVGDGRAVEVLLRRGRAAALLRVARGTTSLRGTLRVRRGRRADRLTVLRGRRTIASGVAARGLSRRTLRALVARARR